MATRPSSPSANSVTYTVKKGDTVWALARRALESETGRKPSNAEIQAMVNKVSVPSGDRNLIRPGEKVKIPLKDPKPRADGRRPAPGGTGRPAPKTAPAKPKASTGEKVAGAAGATAAAVAAGKEVKDRRKKRKARKAAASAAAARPRKIAKSLRPSKPGSPKPSQSGVSQRQGRTRTRTKMTPAQIKGANAAQSALRNAKTRAQIENVGNQIKQSQTLSAADKKRLTEAARNKWRAAAAPAAKKAAKKAGKAVVQTAAKTRPGRVVAGAVAVAAGATKAAKKTAAKKTTAAKKATKKKTTKKATKKTAAKKTTAARTSSSRSRS